MVIDLTKKGGFDKTRVFKSALPTVHVRLHPGLPLQLGNNRSSVGSMKGVFILRE